MWQEDLSVVKNLEDKIGLPGRLMKTSDDAYRLETVAHFTFFNLRCIESLIGEYTSRGGNYG